MEKAAVVAGMVEVGRALEGWEMVVAAVVEMALDQKVDIWVVVAAMAVNVDVVVVVVKGMAANVDGTELAALQVA